MGFQPLAEYLTFPQLMGLRQEGFIPLSGRLVILKPGPIH